MRTILLGFSSARLDFQPGQKTLLCGQHYVFSGRSNAPSCQGEIMGKELPIRLIRCDHEAAEAAPEVIRVAVRKPTHK
jgi:hypothetical protein